MQNDPVILKAFADVRSFSYGDRPAPHKPLMLLLALCALQRNVRWLHFVPVEEAFGQLFRTFGPYRRQPRPQFPFWRLQQDGIWVLPEASRFQVQENASGDVPITLLRDADAQGGFPQELFDSLRSSPELVNAAAAQLLGGAFPPSVHQEILDAVGFRTGGVSRRPRDPRFREEILRIFERRCAVCGYDGRLGPSDLGIEAGHIKWHAAGGPDSADNGLALCAFHHVALDRGAISVDDDLTVQVSQHVVGASQVDLLLLRHAGQPLIGPLRGAPTPNPIFLAWHREHVFRSPLRAAP